MSNGIKLVQRLPFIRNLASGRTVLHLGCTNHPYTEDSIRNGMLLHFDLAKEASKLVGFDYDQQGLDILASHGCTDLYQADLEKLEKVPLDQTFDVIIAGEMIEHLNNPGLFLNGIKRFMHPETKLVITTVNAYCGFRFWVYGLRGKGGRNEPVHPDHVFYFSYSTLQLLIRRHGLNVSDFYFYDLGGEHRPHNSKIYNFINDVSVKIAPQWADGVIAVCKLNGNGFAAGNEHQR